MENFYVENKTFDRINYKENPLTKGEYDNCKFNNCDFSNTNISNVTFLDCEFIGCNLSMANLSTTAFRDIKFKDCKMLGLRFDTCNDFGMNFSFDFCALNHSTFYQTKIKKTIFKNSQLIETDFSDCDLMGSLFDNCDLSGAVFDNTILEKVDFRTSHNYSINPEKNKMYKAKFSVHGIAGLLDKYNIEIE